MQSRIVKAYQAGRLGKVRALQGILTRSFAAKAIAVKRVTELNQGKKTPGIDNELWDTPTAKADALLNKLSQIGYRSLPLKRIFIPKNNGKRRQTA
ncbi:MAG: reverse transcriptase N-terminal domain-containing protein [Clostridiales bacterium]|nr:reverse transcriptase N-terminal domain-containing protein [Clostridiales bacterium]